MSRSEASTRSSPNIRRTSEQDHDPGDDRRRAVRVQARGPAALVEIDGGQLGELGLQLGDQ